VAVARECDAAAERYNFDYKSINQPKSLLNKIQKPELTLTFATLSRTQHTRTMVQSEISISKQAGFTPWAWCVSAFLNDLFMCGFSYHTCQLGNILCFPFLLIMYLFMTIGWLLGTLLRGIFCVPCNCCGIGRCVTINCYAEDCPCCGKVFDYLCYSMRCSILTCSAMEPNTHTV
jgi:hypothetical protein